MKNLLIYVGMFGAIISLLVGWTRFEKNQAVLEESTLPRETLLFRQCLTGLVGTEGAIKTCGDQAARIMARERECPNKEKNQ